MTLQEAFTVAVEGLRSQGFQRSVTITGKCLYRGDHGRKCAIGHLISDDLYTAGMDRVGSISANLVSVLQACGFELSRHDETWVFFNDLQRCHDRAENPADMEARLRTFAFEHNLTYPEAP